MSGSTVENNIHRILDANINRVKEGMRVCEEITRFVLNDRRFTAGLKSARHRMDELFGYLPDREELLKNRRALADIGRKTAGNESKRSGYKDIFFANIQRVKESLRVLEEFSKLHDAKAAEGFKKIRYSIYEIEKGIIGKFPSISDRG